MSFELSQWEALGLPNKIEKKHEEINLLPKNRPPFFFLLRYMVKIDSVTNRIIF